MTVFDIPPDRLPELNDAVFRELVARLCEAERERQEGHRLEVRWGGRQTAADGGLDVVVEATGPFIPHGPLQRRHTGVQVKLGDLIPSAVGEEMHSNGRLRPSISTLAAGHGAYLIVSAGANCSDVMLQRRQDAMRDAVAGDPNAAHINLAFLDRNALARWVSTHPSVAAWLREHMLLPCLDGWKQYGRWSATPSGADDTLICEEGLRFYVKDRQPTTDLVEAIDAIRELVRTGDAAVRIAGLSGIGKSRIVQALFEQVGNTPELPPSQAVYADLGHTLATSPMQMLEAMLQLGAPAVLVADNCPPDTHQALARRLAEVGSEVRLVTVEYDVRSDRPEETDVVRIEAEGPDIVERLLRRRRPDLSSLDARRLAELALGNARLGLALAQAAPQTGSLSTFEEAELFDRLFWQRESRDAALANGAEVLSLVYSFDVEGVEEPDELAVLGSLIGVNPGELYRHAATLLERGLAQARSRWRAILPHALANRLAQGALRNIRWRDVANTFADKPRLRQSLARRLSYLHDVEEARLIVRRWMEPDGPLADPTSEIELFSTVSHLVNQEVLDFVEARIASGEQLDQPGNSIDDVIGMTLRAAHGETLFARSCNALVGLAVCLDPSGETRADAAIENLFGLFLSGTLARTEARISVARDALLSSDQRVVIRGKAMLASALKTDFWSPSFHFDLDARPDAHGWEPRGDEIVEWFEAWFALAAEVANSGNPDAEEAARTALSRRLRELWRCVPSLRTPLLETIREQHARRSWPEARQSLHRLLYLSRRRGDDFPEEDIIAVRELIEELAPDDLEARVHSELAVRWDVELDEDDDTDAAFQRRAERLEELGHELAADPDVLRRVIPEVLRSDGPGFQSLGEGIAEASEDPLATWAILRDAHLTEPDRSRQLSLLSAYLQKLDEEAPETAEPIRQECRENVRLRCDYAFFLPDGALSPEEVELVIEFAADTVVHAHQLADIVWRENRELSDVDRVRLMRSLLSRPEGPRLVVRSLSMLRHVETDDRRVWPEDIRQVGLEALETLISGERVDDNLDHTMGNVTRYCLEEDDGSGAERLLSALTDHATRRYGSIFDVDDTASAIAASAPAAYLNAAIPDPDAGSRGFDLRARYARSPLSGIPPEALVDWCSVNDSRWTVIAQYLELFPADRRGSAESNNEENLSPQIVAILEAAPEPGAVVDALVGNLSPMSWSGSRAAIIERRLGVLEQLQDHPRQEIGVAVARHVPRVREWIAAERERESVEDAARDQRFE